MPPGSYPVPRFNPILRNSTGNGKKLRSIKKIQQIFRREISLPQSVTFPSRRTNPCLCNYSGPQSRTPATQLTTNFKEKAMNFRRLQKTGYWRSGFALAAVLLTGAVAASAQHDRSTLVITSTNNTSGNAIVVFKLNTTGTPSLQLAENLVTGGKGGASTNAGIVQFTGELGAVANYGSNTVNQLVRYGNSIAIGKTIHLAPDCVNPDSVALSDDHLFVVGSTCAESHAWPSGNVDGSVVTLTNPSAAQIAVGRTWAAVTMSSGSVLQLPLAHEDGALSGSSNSITLPDDANSVPLGEAFWGNTLGFTPAHSPDSFAILDENQNVYPVAGPQPSYPTNAPCWLAKGPGNIWYAGNSPGQAVSIFFSDNQGGVFYKSVPVPGVATDITVSPDRKWLAVLYTAGGEGYVAVFSIDGHGDLTQVATSKPIGVAAFSGVAFSQ
jgi:hypothetical protein